MIERKRSVILGQANVTHVDTTKISNTLRDRERRECLTGINQAGRCNGFNACSLADVRSEVVHLFQHWIGNGVHWTRMQGDSEIQIGRKTFWDPVRIIYQITYLECELPRILNVCKYEKKSITPSILCDGDEPRSTEQLSDRPKEVFY